MKATNIIYDVDWKEIEEEMTPEQIKRCFPSEIEIPEHLIDENSEFDDDEISDYISDFTGWCHLGYVLEM